MVAGCPKCSARYRVDPDRIGQDGAKLRCTKCSAVFLVRAPKAQAAPIEVAPPEPEVAPTIESELDSERLVLVADPDEERGKVTAEAIRNWGLSAILVHDGVEAMLAIQRTLPAAIVLDAALPKMFGFQVCEVVKRNESLRETTVILVGAIHHQDRYRRDPAELYGARRLRREPRSFPMVCIRFCAMVVLMSVILNRVNPIRMLCLRGPHPFRSLLPERPPKPTPRHSRK